MAKMDELFNEMCDYCEERGAWEYWLTAKEWNESLGKNYTGASFTALVNWGKLERRQPVYNKKATYEYRIVPIGKIKEKIEEEKRRYEIKDAERIVNNHDEKIALIKERYEKMIKEAEEYLKRNLDFEMEQWEKAKAFLAENK